MEKTYFALVLFFVGLCLGSFVNAAVWRIKHKKDLLIARSECTHCHYKLEWYDLIPVLSWVFLRGKCRKCHKPISPQYPLVELSVAAFFVCSLAFWPISLDSVNHLLQFGIWLMAGVALAILFVYDLRWLILPDRVVFPLIGLGAASAILVGLDVRNPGYFVFNLLGSIAILSGFYFLLYIISKGKWVGFGDIKLGLGLALLLCNWQLAILAFFLANLIGTLVFAPALSTGKIKRTAHIPFGPFLIAGFVIAGLFGHDIIDWYMALTYSGIMINTP
ncbi:prepilin peptidase [Candidatus Saccharibacteria bacterium]|nr:prepilin peptidase [Candidatus Saccharibacteria bacterium]